jgi:glycosyltransferase involved in cell wall biosynthesis
VKVLLVTKTLAEFPEEAGKVREISKLGVHVSVVVPRTWRGHLVEVQRLQSDGYEVLTRYCWFSDRESRRIRYHLHFYPGISRLIANGRWDLVHIDEEPMNFATYHALRGCHKHGRPAVFTTWQSLMKRYPLPFDSFERYVFENAAAGIAGNGEALQILRRRGFAKPVACVPQHGADPALFHREDARDLREKMGLKDAFVIGFAGQIAYRKGLDTLIKSLALLPKECALVLVGTGPDVSKFKSLAQELGLSARVQWRPWVDQREIAKYMCAFDVFVLPSRTLRNSKEQFGRVLIEAMACETPVVGSDSGEIPNVIGDAGLVFHENDERELAGHLRRLMDDPSLRESLARRGRQRVLERFTYEKVARDTVEFYRRICSSAQ